MRDIKLFLFALLLKRFFRDASRFELINHMCQSLPQSTTTTTPPPRSLNKINGMSLEGFMFIILISDPGLQKPNLGVQNRTVTDQELLR